MLLRKLYENRSKELAHLLLKPAEKLTAEEKVQLKQLLFNEKNKEIKQ